MASSSALPPPLVAPLRSLSAAVGGFVAAAGIGAMAVGLSVDSALDLDVRLTTGVVGGLLTLALGLSSIQLGRRRGGLYYEPAGRGVGVGLTATDDLYWIPPESFEGIGVRYHDRKSDGGVIRMWTAELVCSDRPGVVLVEADERQVAASVVAQLSDDSHGTPGLPRIGGDQAMVTTTSDVTARAADEASVQTDTGSEQRDEAPTPAEPVGPEEPEASDCPAETSPLEPGALVHAGVRRGFALGGMFWLFGASLIGVGAALLSQLDASPMMAIFVAPVLLLFGGSTLGIALAKRFAGEEVLVVDGKLIHRWRLGKYTWAERGIDARAVAWRMRVQALKGAYLEALAPDGSLAIGSGATTRSQLSIDGLNRLPERLSAQA